MADCNGSLSQIDVSPSDRMTVMSEMTAVNEMAQQYIHRITAFVEGKQPLDVLAATAKTLERLIADVPADRLRQRPAADKWSVGEILAHLADAEIVIGFRLRWV